MARLPKSIIKKYGITKKAWSVFRGRKKKSRSTPRTRKTRRKGGYRMARRKKRRGGKSIATTAFKWIRIGALVAPAVKRVLDHPGDPGVIRSIISDYTGYNIDTGTWSMAALQHGWLPYLGAVLATYGIPKVASIIRRL